MGQRWKGKGKKGKRLGPGPGRGRCRNRFRSALFPFPLAFPFEAALSQPYNPELPRRRSQVVRQGSAKPSLPGSIPGAASTTLGG